MEDTHRLKAHPGALRLYASRVHLEKQGKDYFGRCCFHKEDTASFSVSQSEGVWLWHCFAGCGGGDIISFVQKMDGIGFKDAVKVVQEFVGDASRVDQVFAPIEPAAKEYKVFSLEQYAKLEQALAESEAGKKWLLDERGITYETAKTLHLGYRQDLGINAGKKNDLIADKGWVSFPCIDGTKVTSIKYRSIVEKSFARQSGMLTELFNLETVDPLEPVWLVEGEVDAATLEQAGLRAVSLPSASYVLSPAQRDALLGAEYVVLAGDADDPGIQAMARLRADFGDRAVKVDWPPPYKDANACFLGECKRDVNAFRELCKSLVATAKSQPMKGVYSLADIMKKSTAGRLADHPNRLHFPWKAVDKMANILPGDVVVVVADQTGTGKTQWVMNLTVHGARKQEEVVLNYQAELSPEEYANITTAHLLFRDRNSLGPDDYHEAAKLLGGIKYYVGADPTLTTAGPVLDLIEEGCRRFGATTVVLDHLHFICRNSSNEVQEQSNAMQRIKNMARQYGLKFIVIGQPRKQDQKNQNRSRELSDVLGSQTITADCSVAFFLRRDVIKNIDPANPPKDELEPECEVRLKKARSKGTGGAYTRLYFCGPQATFREMVLDNSAQI